MSGDSVSLSEDEQTRSSFNLHPNTAKTQFTIQLENNTALKNVNIYNNLGQLVLTTKQTTINFTALLH